MNSLVNQLTKLTLNKTLSNLENVKLLSPKLNLINNEQKRNKGSTVRLNRGPPRPPQPFKEIPRANDYRFRPILPPDEEYTTDALKVTRLGGRNPVTGRVVVKTFGGGNEKRFRWIDFKRFAPENGEFKEKVYIVRYDPWNSHLIALVANNGAKRWIVASEFTKPGDIITTHDTIPEFPIRGKDGDSYRVGALMPGSLIHHIEKYPDHGATVCIQAGTHAKILRRVGSKVIVKLPNKGQEIALDEKCFCTVGKVSNTNNYLVNRLCPQRQRWKGIRPASGLKKKKDGYCGRKIRPPKPLQIFDMRLEEIKIDVTQPIHILQDYN